MDRKAVIKNADMAEDMQQDAVDCASAALAKYNIEKDVAAYIKKVRQRRLLSLDILAAFGLHLSGSTNHGFTCEFCLSIVCAGTRL